MYVVIPAKVIALYYRNGPSKTICHWQLLIVGFWLQNFHISYAACSFTKSMVRHAPQKLLLRKNGQTWSNPFDSRFLVGICVFSFIKPYGSPCHIYGLNYGTKPKRFRSNEICILTLSNSLLCNQQCLIYRRACKGFHSWEDTVYYKTPLYNKRE